MSKCKYLIDISPYDPLCDHPCRLYGGGAVEAECETCQYRIEDLERENAKLRELVSDLIPIVCDGCHERLCDMPKEEHPFVECLFDRRMRELGMGE